MITILGVDKVTGLETPLEVDELSVKVGKDFLGALIVVSLCFEFVGLVGLYK